MRDFVVLGLVGLGTYALRATFLLRSEGQAPKALERYLPFVGPAVLAALVAPGLLAPRGTVSAVESVPAVVAAAVAWLLWRRTGRFPTALVGGLTSWWLLDWLATLG